LYFCGEPHDKPPLMLSSCMTRYHQLEDLSSKKGSQ
jgi:hypothetical protein